MKRPWFTGLLGFSPDSRSWHMGIGQPISLDRTGHTFEPRLDLQSSSLLSLFLKVHGPDPHLKTLSASFTLLLPLLSSPLLIFHFYHSRLRLDLLYLCFSNYSIDTMQVIAWLKINSIKLKIDPTNCRNYLKLGFEPKYLSRWICVRICSAYEGDKDEHQQILILINTLLECLDIVIIQTFSILISYSDRLFPIAIQ